MVADMCGLIIIHFQIIKQKPDIYIYIYYAYATNGFPLVVVVVI